jgi:branched-chain amino acid transport system permease protein
MTATLTGGLRLPFAAGLAALAAWPLVFSSAYDLRVLSLAGIYAILTLGFQFVFGHAGALALTQGTFFGVGAYVSGLLALRLGWGIEATLPLAALAPLVLAAVIAAPVLKLESHYFALATLGIGQVMLLIAIQWQSLTGGANGLPGVPGVRLLGETLPRGMPLLLFVWAFVALGAVVVWRATRGLLGRAYTVMREHDYAAMSLGIDIWSLRFNAFLASAVFAGIAGALYVHTIRVISPEVLEFHIMVAVLSMAVVGGRTHVAGALLGAFLLVHLPEWFRGLDKFYLIAYGAVLLAMIIVAPDGLVGAMEKLRARWFPEPPPPRPAAVPLPVRPAPAATGTAPTAATAPLLRAEGVSLAFGGLKALDGVGLTLHAGEIVGLIGPNGSGKTSLVNCITRLYRADAGAIVFAGHDLLRMAPAAVARCGIARTFQNINLVDGMSALDNVAVARAGVERVGLARALFGLPDDGLAAARGHAMHLLAELGVADVAMRPCGGLAYGIKRRVEIARALAMQPRLLLLDEPAAGLNASEQRDLADRVRMLAGQGLTLLIVEHNMPFLMPLAQRIVCLDAGRVIAAGTPAEIRRDPQVIRAYLGAEPAEATA